MHKLPQKTKFIKEISLNSLDNYKIYSSKIIKQKRLYFSCFHLALEDILPFMPVSLLYNSIFSGVLCDILMVPKVSSCGNDLQGVKDISLPLSG